MRTDFSGVNPFGVCESERAVEGSGIPWTVLRPSGFHSNALRWLPQLVRSDVVEAPWPNVRIASIDPADIAAVAATVLTEPGHEATARSLSRPQSMTTGELVDILGHVLRRPLRFVALDDDVARARMAVDTPAPFVDALFRFFSDGEFDDAAAVGTVAQVTGHASRSFLQWIEDHTGAFASDATGTRHRCHGVGPSGGRRGLAASRTGALAGPGSKRATLGRERFGDCDGLASFVSFKGGVWNKTIDPARF